jgi:hypothetical protein
MIFMTPLSSGGYIHALTHVNMVPRTHPESKAGEFAEGPNPKKKHLLHRLVKKVLIYDRRTIEIWYGLPNQASVRTPAHLAPWAGLEPAT